MLQIQLNHGNINSTENVSGSMAKESSSDEVAIRDVIARVAYAMDIAPGVDELASLVSADVEWTFGESLAAKSASSTLHGRDAVREWATARRASGNQGPSSGTRHFVSNHIVELVSDDTARAHSYFSFYGTSEGAAVLNAVGTYTDTFRRVEGHWLLATRLIEV